MAKYLKRTREVRRSEEDRTGIRDTVTSIIDAIDAWNTQGCRDAGESLFPPPPTFEAEETTRSSK